MTATYEDLQFDIIRVSKDVAKDYPDIDWEDVHQEVALFVIQHGKSIKLREEGGNPRWFLKRVAQAYCKAQRTQHLSLTPQYAYRPSDVKKILETLFEQNPGLQYVPDDARDPLSSTFTTYDEQGAFKSVDVDPFHFSDAMEVSSDVKSALRRIKPEYREAIFNRYVLGIVPENSSWERKKLNKAVNDLTLKLNSYRGSIAEKQGRRAQSNARARAVINKGYE